MRQGADAAEQQRGGEGGGGGRIAPLAQHHALADLEGDADDGRHQEVRVDRREQAFGDGALDVLAQFLETGDDLFGVSMRTRVVSALWRMVRKLT